MKKLLGVSIAAMLAVTPMMASAAPDNNGLEALQMQGLNGQNQLEANTNIATTSYVQGAYNAVATQVNTVQTAINVDKTGAKNLSTGTIGANVKELDTAVGNVSTLSTGAPAGSALANYSGDLVGAVKAINSVLNTNNGEEKVAQDGDYVKVANKVGENLTALDDAIGQIDSSQGKVKNYVATIGTDANQKTVAQNIQTLDNVIGQAESGTYFKAIATTDTANTKTIATSLKDLDTQVVAAEADITRLDGAVGTENSVLYKVYNNAETGKFSGTGTLAEQQTIQAAINEVNRKADATNTAATVTQNGSYVKTAYSVATNLTNLDTATKANADAITDILAANIPVYGEWNNASSTANVSISSLRGANPHAPASVVADPQ